MDFATDRPLSDEELATLLASALVATGHDYQAHVGANAEDVLPRIGKRLQGKEMAAFKELNEEIDQRILELCWQWVGQGLLVPTGTSQFLPTRRGRDLLRQVGSDDRMQLLVPDGVARTLRERCPGIDETTLGAAARAHDCYLAMHWASSIILLGVATESAALPLARAVERARGKLELSGTALPRSPAAWEVLDWLRETFETNRGRLRHAFSERSAAVHLIDDLLNALAPMNSVRATRNREGHPNPPVDRQTDAQQYFAAFPHMAETVFRCIGALETSWHGLSGQTCLRVKRSRRCLPIGHENASEVRQPRAQQAV